MENVKVAAIPTAEEQSTGQTWHHLAMAHVPLISHD